MNPRDPHRRQRILDAARVLIPVHGIAGLTHRLVAAEAGVPVGSTTYYFADLADLTAAALADTAKVTREVLRGWSEALGDSEDLPATLAALTADCLARPEQLLTVNELYLAAARLPELRPPARVWFDGLVEILTPHAGPVAARAVAIYLDGTLLHALTIGTVLDAGALTAPIAALTGLTPRTAP
ncbi:TetR family transcriptional regulator [Nocardia sp. NPDC004568]|uniref:TetR/AcrR family transcriptional regulator n=1 Tax=Nocardia sp. NPDC004568 TaxID=3154551 RepID=UPI0033B4A16B